MKTFTANEAKQHFGQVLDSSLQGPVSITKHGSPSAVVTSRKDYDELLRYKHESLKAEVQKGFEQLDRGEFSNRDFDEIAEQSLNLHLDNKGSGEVPWALAEAKGWPEGYIESLRNNAADETFTRHA